MTSMRLMRNTIDNTHGLERSGYESFRVSAVQSSAEACLRQQLLQPPAPRMEVHRPPVSPLRLAPAVAAIANLVPSLFDE